MGQHTGGERPGASAIHRHAYGSVVAAVRPVAGCVARRAAAVCLRHTVAVVGLVLFLFQEDGRCRGGVRAGDFGCHAAVADDARNHRGAAGVLLPARPERVAARQPVAQGGGTVIPRDSVLARYDAVRRTACGGLVSQPCLHQVEGIRRGLPARRGVHGVADGVQGLGDIQPRRHMGRRHGLWVACWFLQKPVVEHCRCRPAVCRLRAHRATAFRRLHTRLPPWVEERAVP